MHIPKSRLAGPWWSIDFRHLGAAKASLALATSAWLQQGIELFEAGRNGARATDLE